jgi:tight adherence protein B
VTPAAIAVLLLITLVLAVLALAVLSDGRARDRRMRQLAVGSGATGRMSRLWSRTNRALTATAFGERLEQRLQGAAVRLTPLKFLAAVLGSAVALALLLRPLLGTLGSLLLVVAAYSISNRFLESRRQKRLEAFVGQLPDLARILSNAASAGQSLRAALALAGRELEDPAGTELLQVSDAMKLGVSLDRALGDLRRRLPSRELAVLVQTLVIQSRAGGALVSALLNIATTLEQRKELRREVRTATAGAVYSGYVVLFIGVASVFVMNLLTPGALDQLSQTTLGRLVLLVAGTFFGVGLVLVRRLTRIEV